MEDTYGVPSEIIASDEKIKIQISFAKNKKPKFMPMKQERPFITAIIDPDWPYTNAPGKANIEDVENKEKKGRLSGFTRNKDISQNQYETKTPLTIEELKSLRVNDVVDGYVFLWTVGPFLINGNALDVLKAWEFEPVSIITWAKYDLKNNHGYGGVGFWFLGNAEFCIVGKRKGWPSIRTGISSLIVEPPIGESDIIMEPKRRHSQKPDNIHILCETRFQGPYLELFGRESRQNWRVIGDEAPGNEEVRQALEELACSKV